VPIYEQNRPREGQKMKKNFLDCKKMIILESEEWWREIKFLVEN